MRKLSTREQMAYRTIATLELERDALQQRLTVAEQLLREIRQTCELSKLRDAQIDAALKPAAEGEGS